MRNKANEENIFKLKNDFIDMKNSNEFMNQIPNNIKEHYKKLLNEIESKLNLINNKYDEIMGLKQIFENSVNKAELKKIYIEQNLKINEFLKNSGKNIIHVEKINEIYKNLKSDVK